MKRNILFIILFGIISSYSNGQTRSGKSFKEISNILYVAESEIENDSLQRLNIILPGGGDDYPLLVWIGGGAWSYGDRNQEMNLARQLAKAGIGVASVSHRLSPATWKDPKLNTGVQHPKHIEDVAAATRWLLDNADKYGYDKDNIFIGGFSSGGHLAALITLDSTYLVRQGLSTRIFKGVIPISGTYDILNYYQVLKNGSRPELGDLHVKAVFGNNENDFYKASPASYLNNLSLPLLLICDNSLYGYTSLFEEKIRSTDFRKVQVVYAYHFSHGELWRDMSFNDKSMYRDIIVRFIQNLAQKN